MRSFDPYDYSNRQLKLIIIYVYNSWKEGDLIKGREHILLSIIFRIMNYNMINTVDEILKIVYKLNASGDLSRCSKKCKDGIKKLKK